MRHNNLWGSLNHKNVAPVYGVALGISHMPSIVMPRYKEGNAVTYLRAHPLVNKLKVVGSFQFWAEGYVGEHPFTMT